VVAALLDRYGQTYAEQAGIRLADKPSPLYELLVLTNLLSARIQADIAVSAARELFAAGYRTPQHMRAASWQDRVDALGRGHYQRYDESTATTLGQVADQLIGRWHGDLRRLRDAAGSDPQRIRDLLLVFKGIGPTGVDIFLREVQVIWPGVGPYLDRRVAEGARLLGLPQDARELAPLAGSPVEVARLAVALVRVARQPEAVKELSG
jgi:hypothetical protein